MSDNFSLEPMANGVLVNIYDDGGKSIKIAGGVDLIVHSDDKFGAGTIGADAKKSHRGLRPRWAKVLAVSPECKQFDIKVGDKVFIEQLRWTRCITTDPTTGDKVWRVSVDDIMGVDDDGFTEDELEYIAQKNGKGQ